MYGYIYLTTNKINNKKYIGQHCSEIFDTKYFGSGKKLKSAIKKYGIENFKCEILKICFSQEELDEAERYYINIFKAYDNPEYYNIALGGKMCQLAYQTEETKRKIGASNKGKKRTPGANERNKEQRLGSKWMHKDSKQSLVFKDLIQYYLTAGWEFGMLPNRKSYSSSEEKKNKISRALKNKKKNESSVEKQRESIKSHKYHWYTNGVDSKLIGEEEQIPDGYCLGRLYSEEARLKNSLAHKGRVPWNKKLNK